MRSGLIREEWDSDALWRRSSSGGATPNPADGLGVALGEAHGVPGLVQYSSALMIVRTRVVTAGSAGSGEPNSVFLS